MLRPAGRPSRHSPWLHQWLLFVVFETTPLVLTTAGIGRRWPVSSLCELMRRLKDVRKTSDLRSSEEGLWLVG